MNKDLLHRMKSIRQTIQIGSAQKLVASARVGRARKMLSESKPYHDRVISAISDILRQCPEIAERCLETERSGNPKRGLVVLSANHGLAGGFNSNVIHFTEQSLKEKPATYILVLGRACRNHLIRKGFPVEQDCDLPLEPPTMATAREIAEKMMEMLENGQIDTFDIIYTHYKSPVRMRVEQERLYPIDPSMFKDHGAGLENSHFEPDPEHVFASITLKYIKGFLYGCLVNTWLCELTARITAMDNAIRNGNEMLEHLSLLYNRVRQAAITQEITEIVAGAAALEEDEE